MAISGDPTYYYGDPEGFVTWDRTRVIRTWDIRAASPTYENISTGIDGNIRDCQCVIADDGTVGAWLLTSTAIFWCADIKATTPTWSEILAVETVIASDAVFAASANEIKAIAVANSMPGFCIAATGPNATAIASSYEHAYWWMTDDYGQSWTKSDMSGYIVSNLSIDRGYYLCGTHAIQIQEHTGDIFAVRSAPRAGSNSRTAVFRSSDLGVTWSMLVMITLPSDDTETAPILVPAFDGDMGYFIRGNQAVNDPPNLYISDDEFADATELSYPAGYDGVSGVWQPVRVGENGLLLWHKIESTSTYDLLFSTDNGGTWELVYAGNGTGITAFTSRHSGPIPWFPNPDLWAFVNANPSSSPIADAVFYTEDFFANVENKTGNLEALLGTWSSADISGFFLPKPPVAIDRYMVADGHDAVAGEMTVLTPQPHCKGVRITRRDPSQSNEDHEDEGLYIVFEYGFVTSDATYQAILSQWGLLTALENDVTATAKDRNRNWQRWNGTVRRPRVNEDMKREEYFPRDVSIYMVDVGLAA